MSHDSAVRAVSYCVEIDSAQCHTVGRLTLRRKKLHGDSEKFEYLTENQIKIENSLAHWSVTQAGLNDEKTGGRKSRWSVPLMNPL